MTVQITEVRIKLMDDLQERLLAFCSITIDGCFVIRDLKIIRGAKGPFVAMPSRKLCDRCPECGSKNHLRSSYCTVCGVKLEDERAEKDHDGRARLYADIAHPINSECRDHIQSQVLHAYEGELELAKQPGYVCHYDDFGEDDYEHEDSAHWSPPPESAVRNGASNGVQRRVDPGSSPRKAAASQKRHAPSAPLHARADDFGEGIL